MGGRSGLKCVSSGKGRLQDKGELDIMGRETCVPWGLLELNFLISSFKIQRFCDDCFPTFMVNRRWSHWKSLRIYCLKFEQKTKAKDELGKNKCIFFCRDGFDGFGTSYYSFLNICVSSKFIQCQLVSQINHQHDEMV